MRALHKLTTLQVRNAPPGKYNDGAGLWLVKRADGGAQWVLRLSIHGRRREMGLGRLSAVSLKAARQEAERWREVSRSGKDPIKERDRVRRQAARDDHTLAVIAEDAFEARKAELKGDGKPGQWFSPLENHILPKLGGVPVSELDQNDIRQALAPIWHEKAEAARKGINRLAIVLRHAAALGIDVDLQAVDKAKALLGKSRHTVRHHVALPWSDVPEFYASLDHGTPVHLAMRLLILTAARSGEIRQLHLDELDGDIWAIPAA